MVCHVERENEKPFSEAMDFDLWDFFISGPFIPTRFINNETVNKSSNLLTIEELLLKLDT